MSSPVSTKLPLVGHTNLSTAIATFTQSIAIKPLACSPKGVRGRFPVRRCLTTRRCGYLGPPSNSRCHSVPHAAIAASRDASTVGPRPTASWRSSKIFVSKARRQSRSLSRNVRRTRDCLNLGSHTPRLTPAHDEKIARSTEQNAGRCDAESTKPHLSAPIGYEYESSSLSTLFSSCRARRRNDRRLR